MNHVQYLFFVGWFCCITGVVLIGINHFFYGGIEFVDVWSALLIIVGLCQLDRRELEVLEQKLVDKGVLK